MNSKDALVDAKVDGKVDARLLEKSFEPYDKIVQFTLSFNLSS